MSTIPFAVDRFGKFLFPDFHEARIATLLNGPTRRFVVVPLACFGVLVACFLSFRQEWLLARANNSGSLTYDLIESDKIQRLTDLIAKVSPKPTVMIGWDGDTSTFRTARQIYDALKKDGIDAPPQRGARDRDNEYGIELMVDNRFDLTSVQKEVYRAFQESQIAISIEKLEPDDPARSVNISIFVCPRGPR